VCNKRKEFAISTYQTWSPVASATEEFESAGKDIYNSIKTIVDIIGKEFNIFSAQTLIVPCELSQ